MYKTVENLKRYSVKIIIIGIAFTLIFLLTSLLVFLYTPRNISSLFLEESNYVILRHSQVYAIERNSYLYGFGTIPGVEEIHVSFESGTHEFQEIINVLSNFSFHRPIASFFRNELNARVGNDVDDLFLMFVFFDFDYDYEIRRLFFRNTNGLNFMTDNQVYSIKSNEIASLISQILTIMTENSVE